jgi:cytochrome b pre-mRNA-processing protein 3
MILSLFKNRSPVPGVAYERVMQASREPALYAEIGVPDTIDGRLEMLTLHLFLLMRRMKPHPELGDLAQDIVDLAFSHLDRTLRETGVGDLSVPKKMKALAKRFYGRIAAYDGPVTQGNHVELEEALGRIVFDATTHEPDIGRLATYVFHAAAHLESVPDDELLRGNVTFPAP